MADQPESVAIEQHPLALSILLHLLPGILATFLYVVLSQFLVPAGFPGIATLLLAALLTIVPFELGVLLYEARRKNGSFSLKDVVLYREPIPWWQYIVFPLVLLTWAALVFGVLSFTSPLIKNGLFAWLPSWYDVAGIVADTASYSRVGLIATLVLGIGFNVLAGPIIEELYFRGYLLPRLSRFGWWAPVINVVLFSLYHLWTPWENLMRIGALIPMASAVQWRKNITIGMITHVLLNAISFIYIIGLVTQALK